MRHHHSPGIRGQLMWFLCCICLFLLALVWFLSTQLLEPLYTKHIEKQLTTQAESITAELDKAIANGEALSAWSFGHLTVNTTFFDRLATQLYASGSLNSFCVDISDTTMRTIYKIENQSYCNLHETLLSDSANNDMIVSTAVAMRKKCRTTGGFVQTLNPPRLSGSAQLLVGRNTSGGEYTVLVTTSLVHVAEAGKVLSTVLPMAAALIFAFAMTAAWLFSEWFTKPLRQLSSAARQMAMGNYAVQVDTRRSDELGDLARDFNHMASEVQHSSQMQRALHNLLGNAMHHIGKDGIFILRAQRCTEGVRIEVEDHGPGISADDLPYIFDRYYRSRSDAGKQGTGLGLSITKAIFQQHGFRFGVQSAIGMGTTFWFIMNDLPANAAEMAGQE